MHTMGKVGGKGWEVLRNGGILGDDFVILMIQFVIQLQLTQTF